MALELFKPFVIGYLIEKDFAHNIKAATRLIEMNEVAVWDALDEVIKGKYVLLNRAPTLHRLGIQAFQPKLIEGKAIQLHPLVCKGFNADFDGDQMAVHLPLSDAAQNEAKELMGANRNILRPSDGAPVLHIDQDMVLGAYFMTYEPYEGKEVRHFSSLDEAIFAYDQTKLLLQEPISVPFRGKVQESTLGRVLFNEIFPEAFNFVNDTMTKKKLFAVMASVYRECGQDATAEVADNLKDLAFEYATVSGLSMGMDDFVPVNGIDAVIKEAEKRAAQISEQYELGFITNDERYRLIIENWTNVDSTVTQMLVDQMKGVNNTMSIAVTSGARGSISQMKDSVGMLGIRSDATGRAIELPVKSNYKNGLNTLEYFTGARGARKALVDIALRTADSGYLTRRLVDVSQDVFTVDVQDEDPGHTMHKSDAAELGITLGQRLIGRYLAEDVSGVAKRGDLVTDEVAKQIDEKDLESVKIMSVISATTVRGIPQKSYGIDPANGNLVVENHPIGVIAAQSIGEPGTQLSLDSKHRAGSVVEDDAAQGLNRVEELFEVRAPKGQAYISDIEGTVRLWEEGDQYIVQIAGNDQKQTALEIGGRTVQVGAGTEVAIGDVLASDDAGMNPLITPVSGTVEITPKEIIVTPHESAAVRYEIPGFKNMVVKDGDKIGQGDRLTTGSINLHDLLRLKGVEETQRYIINDIRKLFASQGQPIADKHIEIIIKQMFSRVQLEDAGDSTFVTGDIASKAAVVEENARLVKEGKNPAVYSQLLLGITKVSTWSDSFLSAASFQDTTRVLITAATSGKMDSLYGLKENVILGRKIPVGTGVVAPEDEAGDAEDIDDNE
jgi:DNA-directed RNA polymerase subunit beta'